MRQGRLILCATPIGNLEDVSARMARVLSETAVIACEDTRRTRKLLSHLGISARELVTYNDTNERKRVPELLDRLRRGTDVVLVSDAGMPGLSDPGYRLVRACAEEDIPVEVVPGPNAAVSALAASGLPPGRYAFEGFLPRKASERQRRIAELADDTHTLVFYESPHRIIDSLSDLHAGLGDRPAAIARELTKIHEEIRRGTLSELLASAKERPPRGEIVLVVSGAIHEHAPEVSDARLASSARELMAKGVERKEALARVARENRVPRRRVFDALLDRGD